MQTETKKQWWQQLAGMSQGMLFLHGHVVHPAADAAQAQGEHRHHAHDSAGKARQQRALQRLGERRLRAMTSLSLFR